MKSLVLFILLFANSAWSITAPGKLKDFRKVNSEDYKSCRHFELNEIDANFYYNLKKIFSQEIMRTILRPTDARKTYDSYKKVVGDVRGSYAHINSKDIFIANYKWDLSSIKNLSLNKASKVLSTANYFEVGSGDEFSFINFTEFGNLTFDNGTLELTIPLNFQDVCLENYTYFAICLEQGTEGCQLWLDLQMPMNSLRKVMGEESRVINTIVIGGKK